MSVFWAVAVMAEWLRLAIEQGAGSDPNEDSDRYLSPPTTTTPPPLTIWLHLLTFLVLEQWPNVLSFR